MRLDWASVRIAKDVDTRIKIVGPEQARQAARRNGGALKLVTGFFDPLLAAHARRLSQIAASGGALVVAVGEPPRPLLPARARAELVAALAAVDYVVLPAPGEDLLERLRPDAVFEEESADGRRTEELIRHVQARQQTS